MPTKVVTDSVTDLPAEWIAAHDITVLPAYINIGSESLVDGRDITHEEFYARLEGLDEPISTATPAAGAFAETYRRLAESGATDIISIHISAQLSGMLNAARLGAEEAAEVRVHLFDTGQLSIAAGFLVRQAAMAAAEGTHPETILAMLDAAAARARIYGFIDTLSFLRRSGRISWAEAGLGALLQVKPIFRVSRGEIAVIERARTRRRALEQLITLLGEVGPFAELAIIHANAPEMARALYEASRPHWGDEPPLTRLITPTFAAHVGPGAVGFAFLEQ